MFHSRTVPFPAAVAKVRPSEVNATAKTLSVLPVRGWPSKVGRLGSLVFHSRTVPS